MKTLGARYTDEEYRSFMHVWRYSGHLMGIPETILFRDAQAALKLYDIGLRCEPAPGMESIAMAHSLVNSAPVIAGAANPKERRDLARYVYRLSTGLIGKRTAASLEYPRLPVFGVVGWFRARQRLDVLAERLLPGHKDRASLKRFGYLLAGSTYDSDGINYRMPDHVYAERTDW